MIWKKEAFQDENAFQKAQEDFKMFMKYAENWRISEFISAPLGLLAMTSLAIICIF